MKKFITDAHCTGHTMLRSNAKQIEKRKHLGGEEGVRALYRGPVVSGSPFLLRVTFKIPIVYEETR